MSCQKQLLEMFYKKGVIRNFAKFTGKHLCQRVFFNKVAGLRTATLLKKTLRHRSFPVNFAKVLRTPASVIFDDILGLWVLKIN